MKRTIALIAILTILTCATTKETWYALSHSDDYRVYFYASVVNNGEKPTSINDLLFEIQDASGDTIESTSKYKLYPEVLEAGQTGWLMLSKDVKDVKKEDIDHYNLTITSKVNDDKAAHALIATAEYLEKDEDDNEDVIRATVTNDTQENAFAITIAMAVRDADGKLLYVTGDTTKDIGLAPGCGLMNRSLIRSDIMDELEDNHVEIASAEAIAYTVEDLKD